MKTGLPGGTQTTRYLDGVMEIEEQGTRTTYRHYLDGIAVLNKEVDGATTTWTMAFNLKDRLGSVVTLADDTGSVREHRSYDPFGKPRRGDFIDATHPTIASAIAEDTYPAFSADPQTDRGFTDHEHLDDQEIIHMNGRVFDFNIGRFTSVDPFVVHPTNSQSINPYTYILNSPLSGTDPTGYKDIGDRSAAAGYGFRVGLTEHYSEDDYDLVMQGEIRTGNSLALDSAGLFRELGDVARVAGSAGVLGALAAWAENKIKNGEGFGRRKRQSGGRQSTSNGERGQNLSQRDGAIQENEVTTYRDFRDRSVKGDDLEGHEVLQNANLNERKFSENRLDSDASKDNPVIALDKKEHTKVNREQRRIDARNQSGEQNIRDNVQILRDNPNVPADAVDKIESAALEHNRRLEAGDYPRIETDVDQ